MAASHHASGTLLQSSSIHPSRPPVVTADAGPVTRGLLEQQIEPGIEPRGRLGQRTHEVASTRSARHARIDRNVYVTEPSEEVAGGPLLSGRRDQGLIVGSQPGTVLLQPPAHLRQPIRVATEGASESDERR